MVPKNGIKRIPWFMIPLYTSDTIVSTNILITTDTVPKEVTDTKKLNYYEQQLPGGYTSIHKYGSASARHISFKLEIADFNDNVGLGIKLSQFDLLRRPRINIMTPPLKSNPNDILPDINKDFTMYVPRYKPFHANPYVIYYNSIFNTIPLPFKVLKCDFVTSKPNRLGKPQYAVIDFDLAQMEESLWSATEDKIKYFAAIAGMAGSVANLIRNFKSKTNTRNVYRNMSITSVRI
jgi:hypothetical protein